MNNNLINFINGKMGKIYIEVGIIRTLITLLDNKLYNKDDLKDFTEEEIKELRVTLYTLEKIYNILNDEYNNLNIIRMNVLGLI